MLAFPLIRTFLVLYFLGFDCIHLSIFISDVILSWFWLYPSQHVHFWCDIFLVLTVSISASSFLMWYFLGFYCTISASSFLMWYFLGCDCIHLSIFISDVIFSWLWLYPSQHVNFWCDIFLVVTVSISACSFLMWYFLGCDCIHLSIFISDVIFSWFWLYPSQHLNFWCDIFLVVTVSISASSFLMWYLLGFDCIHLSIFISDVIFSWFWLYPSQHLHFWCDIFLVWLYHLSIFISDVIFSSLWLYPSQRLHFWCDIFLFVTVSISASSFMMWHFLGFDRIHLSIFI